ncbi:MULTISPECIES: SlyX family protein [Xanthomonas]|uniref:SlyX family protein n=1 Tax=Xanthomonas TaxID=338 RepID=UPI001ADC0CAC|nr:SlyX family protein [Xanthomonas phaseoli]MBO9766576.1 SlyX family protein [Xanthomonas phaseoli pv. dieffenbachiae]MBO9776078.1 SlyX family protein [Xanthomonas phaseoli pv. dieffenbachiae]MBO9778323.1 SlyX family protein [Xanthomonas phaseoli pv. dieffenbachiae]MBO9795289.1 SlyX family protein [Xanthomonas phaseoli pv. dieffenbachiae]MBO9801516.1 SlyX family protein [Xanthomonas phaseoli pv. dieffenbachiae]
MHEQFPLHDRALEARLIELETRLSFQEQALNELSEALADARLTGARNAELIRHLLEDLGKVRSTLFADAADEPPPPHY